MQASVSKRDIQTVCPASYKVARGAGAGEGGVDGGGGEVASSLSITFVVSTELFPSA